MLLKSVVLPDPLGPKIEINSPLFNFKIYSFKAMVPPSKVFLNFLFLA